MNSRLCWSLLPFSVRPPHLHFKPTQSCLISIKNLTLISKKSKVKMLRPFPSPPLWHIKKRLHYLSRCPDPPKALPKPLRWTNVACNVTGHISPSDKQRAWDATAVNKSISLDCGSLYYCACMYTLNCCMCTSIHCVCMQLSKTLSEGSNLMHSTRPWAIQNGNWKVSLSSRDHMNSISVFLEPDVLLLNKN